MKHSALLHGHRPCFENTHSVDTIRGKRSARLPVDCEMTREKCGYTRPFSTRDQNRSPVRVRKKLYERQTCKTDVWLARGQVHYDWNPLYTKRLKVKGAMSKMIKMREKAPAMGKGALTDVAQHVFSGQVDDMIAHFCWGGPSTKDVQGVSDQTGDCGSSHRCARENPIAAVDPGGSNIGSRSKNVHDGSEVGVACPTIGYIRCTDGDSLAGIRRAGKKSILTLVSLYVVQYGSRVNDWYDGLRQPRCNVHRC